MISDLLFFNSAHLAFAYNDAPQNFTLDAQIFQAGTSNPLLDASVHIRVQILNQDKDCVLYEEEQSVDTTGSNGYFIIHVGSVPGNSLRTANDSGHTMTDLFQNVRLIGGKSLSDLTVSCNSAANLTSLSKSVRFFRVTITASTSTEPDILTPDLQVEAVPTALIAETLQGLDKTQFVQTNSGQGVTQANLESVFARFTNLDAILGSNTTGNISANVTGTAANISGIVAINHGGTGATSATAARANLGLGPLANFAITSGSADATSYLRGDGTWAAIAVGGGTFAPIISSASLAQVIRYNGANWVNATLSSADLSNDNTIIKSTNLPTSCTANQTLTFA